MNSLQELRATLDAHAATVHDDVTHARTAAVRGRARVVRRRRTAATGAAAALAVAAVAAVSVLPGDRDPAPADRELIGREAPESLTSLGYTYDFVEGVESNEGSAAVRLRSADVPRLITWASEADQVRVESNVESYGTWSTATDFDDFVIVPAVESGRWQIRAGGADSAIAVYELSEEPPPGVTVDDITFRERVGGEELLDARIGAVGVSDLTLEVTLPAEGLRVAELCTGLPDGYTVNVEVDDRGVVSSGGCVDDAFDPASGSAASYEPGELGRAGRTARVRTWISRKHDGPVVDVEGVRLGLAGYRLPPPVVTLAGWDVPDVYEHDGHLWRYVDSVETTPGEDRLVLDRDWERPTLVVTHTRGVQPWRGTVMVGRGMDATLQGGGGASSGIGGVLGPGRDRFPITVRRGLTDRTVLGVSLYERAD